MLSVLLPAALAVAGASATGQTIWYVDDDAPIGGDGGSWQTGYRYLQDGLAAANPGDEIRVAQGVYRPDRDEGGNVNPGDREASFQLTSGLALYGGYAGITAPDPDERDISGYQTILSGDLAGDDGPNFRDYAENAYHVVTGSGTEVTAVLDGFTITSGNANGGDQHIDGGGMYNSGGSPTVVNCNFRGNAAENDGGGMGNWYGSSPSLTNCAFGGNSTQDDGGGMGNHENSNPTVTDCSFTGNSAKDDGGGMDNDGSSPSLTNCTFTGNSAQDDGGGMANHQSSSPTLTHCIFKDNSAGQDGGGMDNRSGSNPALTNCSFSGNSASDDGGGMHNIQSSPTLSNCTFSDNSAADNGGGMYDDDTGRATVTNCVLWGNSDSSGTGEAAQVYGAAAVVSHSCIQGCNDHCLDPGDHNIGDDPLHVIGPLGDYYLSQIAAGQEHDSPCVDAGGDTAVNLGLDLLSTRTDAVGDAEIVDMGYHYVMDCNGNDIPDQCDLCCGSPGGPCDVPGCGGSWDCNGNNVPDECDIANGTSRDCQPNGIPDECDGGCLEQVLRQLSIRPTEFTLDEIGATLQLTVTGTFSDGSKKDLTPGTSGTEYTSSDESVLVVDMDGLVTASGKGSATITATNDGFQAEAVGAVTVEGEEEPVLESIDVTPASLTITVAGGGQQLTVVGTLSDGETVDLTLATTGTIYRSSDNGVATVSVDGLVVEGGGNSNATITVTNSGFEALVAVTVNVDREQEPPGPSPGPDNPALDRIEFTVDEVEIDEGSELHLIVRGILCDGSEVADLEGSDQTTFESSDPAVATVTNEGLLTGVAQGKTVITVAFEGLTDELNVTVRPAEEGPAQPVPNDGKDMTQVGCGHLCGALGFAELLLIGLALCGLRRGR